MIKAKPFFADFEWDKLIEFQMKPPFIPRTTDMSEYLKELNPYELFVSQDNTNISTNKEKGELHIPVGYDRAWVEEF